MFDAFLPVLLKKFGFTFEKVNGLTFEEEKRAWS